MFDTVRNNPKFVQIFLALITVPFALFGVDAYFRNAGGGGDYAAKVGAVEVSAPELDRAIRDQENNLRSQMGDAFDRNILESSEFKNAVLDRLINEKALGQTILQAKLQVPDAFVQSFIKSLPQFQENGQFSMRLYEAIVRSQGLTAQGFEDKVRTSLAQQMLLAPLVESAAVSRSTAARWIALSTEERSVSEWALQGAAFMSRVKLADDAAKKFYDANQSRFQVPEQAKIEYVVLSADDLAGQVTVSDADAKKWYDEHSDRFQVAEERRARHILIQADKTASAEVKQAAKKRAEDLLVKVKANPEKFEAFAKENSDDKMSAVKGGDLGFFGKGAMVKAFEDTAFQLKPKDISNVVETEFGYHIIQLTEVKAGKTKSFDEVKAEAMDEVKKQAANKRFGELADQFSNMVYEQPDALKPVAEKFGLKLQQTDWVAKGAVTAKEIDNPKIQSALFAGDAIKSRRNTEAVDLGNGKMISARLADYRAASVKPFESVKADVEKVVIAQEAGKLAQLEGEADLAKLKTGETIATASWSASKSLTRANPELDDATRKAIFGASVKSLPAFVGVAKGSGYSIYKIEKVSEQKVADSDPRVKDVSQQYGKALGQEDIRGFIAAVRDRLGVKIKEDKSKSKS